ncbi:MAG: putative DNA binding domain-containing protein [Succinivibrio sp.]|nr:putative DNA binding domain-containing protein [Succinivibrio sp.]
MINAENLNLYLKQSNHVGLAILLAEALEELGKTISAMLNRFGGQIIIGTDGKAQFSLTSEEQAAAYCTKITNYYADEENLKPAILLKPSILKYKHHYLISIQLCPGSAISYYKGQAYLRRQDQNIPLSQEVQLRLSEAKANYYLENTIYPYASIYDLNIASLSRIRSLASQVSSNDKYWFDLKDHDLLSNAGFYVIDQKTAKKGLTLAGILTLGKDDIIARVIPTYSSLIQLNLNNKQQEQNLSSNLFNATGDIQTYLKDKLKFITDGLDSLKTELFNQLLHEIIVNFLIHRDFSSALPSRVIIKDKSISFSNPSHPFTYGEIKADDNYLGFKNPHIEKFFKAIGWASLTGNGLSKITYLTDKIFGTIPKISEGELFSITLPLIKDQEVLETNPQYTNTPPIQTSQSGSLSTENKENIFRPIEPNPGLSTQNPFKANFIKNIQNVKNGILNNLNKSALTGMVQPDQTDKYSLKDQIENLDQTDSSQLTQNNSQTNHEQNSTEATPEQNKIIETNQQSTVTPPAQVSALHREIDGKSNKRRGTILENNSDWLPFADPQIELLNLIKINPNMTNVELAETLGWSTGRIKFYVGKLKKAGAISRVGTDRKGYWKVF